MSKKKIIDLPCEMLNAAAKSPIDYLREYWIANSTEEERKAADERDATIEGAYEFIENFARRNKNNKGCCLPDQLTYDLACIFMRVCVDGDVYATADEIAAEEAAEAERKAAKERAEEAVRKSEEEMLAGMTAEERLAYEREKARKEAEAAARKAEDDKKRAEQAAIEKAKRERREELARKKALAEEMAKRQMTFF